jgi:excisionase family DNA binding protein
MPDPLAFTIPQAMSTAGVRKTSLYAAIKRGDLRAKKSGRRTLILRADLHAWLVLRADLHAWLEQLPALELQRQPRLETAKPARSEATS